MRNILIALCIILTCCAVASSTPKVESKPAERNGLSVTVDLKTVAFGVDPQWPIFTVQFKNTSANDMTLRNADAIGVWKIRFTRKGLAGYLLLQFEPFALGRPISTSTLKPGATLDVAVDLNQTPRGGGFSPGGVPTTQPSAPLQHLPAGQYQMAIEIQLSGSPTEATTHYWTGTLKTNPIDIRAQDADAIYSGAIHRVTDRFDKFGGWNNGLFGGINLPADADPKDVIAQAVKNAQIKSYQILDVRLIMIEPLSDPTHAAVLQTDAGTKVLIFLPFKDRNEWWSRFYDSSLTSAIEPAPHGS